MKKRVFGEHINADDIERMPSDQPQGFIRLCNALISAAHSALLGQAVPLLRTTERFNVRDGGVDAQSELLLLTESAPFEGLCGRGFNIYQYKWRSVIAGNRDAVLTRLQRRLVNELQKLASLPDRYVLLTNLHLGLKDHHRLKEALQSGYPALQNRPCLVWGAADIAAFLNGQPRLRHAFFCEGSLATLDVIEDELKGSYRHVSWPEFVLRKEAETVREVAGQPGSVIVVSGPREVGKTRLVLEALREVASSVVWASDPDEITLDHFRNLAGEAGTILVLDDCRESRVPEMMQWALRRQALVTFLISSQPYPHPNAHQIHVERMDADLMDRIIAHLAPEAPHMRRLWIRRVADGLPGLACHAAACVMPSDATTPPSPGELYTYLKARFTRDLPDPERRALEVFSLLPKVQLDGREDGEVGALCRAAGAGKDSVLASIPGLKSRGLLFDRDPLVEVAPEVLGDLLAGDLFLSRPALPAEILLRLPRDRHGALFQKLGRLLASDGSAEPRLKGLFADLLGEHGVLQRIPDLDRHGHVLEALAPQHPKAALAALERLVGSASREDLNSLLQGMGRFSVANTFRHLLHRPDTFDSAARTLVNLARAESTNGGKGFFTATLLPAFHYLHPTTSVPLAHRLAFLQTLAQSPADPPARRLAVMAAGAALGPALFLAPDTTEGPEFPPLPSYPRSHEEVDETILALLDVLQRGLADAEETVRTTSRDQIAEGFEHVIHAAWRGSSFQRRVVERASEVLRAAYEGDQSAHQRSRLLSSVERVEATLEKERDHIPRSQDSRDALDRMAARLHEFEEELIGETWSSRLRRHAGPRSYAQTRAETSSRTIDPVARAREADDLVRGALPRNPEWLDSELDWLVNEAERCSDFFMALGRFDEKGGWRRPLLDRAGHYFGPEAFGFYVAGRASCGGFGGEGVDDYLDRLALDVSAPPASVACATLRRPLTDPAVDRFVNVVRRSGNGVPAFIQDVVYSHWQHFLSTNQVEKLVLSLDDGSTEAAEALVYLLNEAVEGKVELTLSTRTKSWVLLDRIARSVGGVAAHTWDELASRLGKREPERLLDVLKATLIETLKKGLLWDPWRFRESVNTLETHHRSALVRTLLEIAGLGDPGVLDASPFHHVLDPIKDRPLLIEWIRGRGYRSAANVLSMLHSGSESFLEFASSLVRATGGDSEVVGALTDRLCSLHLYQGRPLPELERRLERIRRRIQLETDPLIVAWLTSAQAALEAEINPRSSSFWDVDLSRRDLESQLDKADSPERRWAVRRILEYAPPQEALRLLRHGDLRAAVEDPHLDAVARERWKTYLDYQDDARG